MKLSRYAADRGVVAFSTASRCSAPLPHRQEEQLRQEVRLLVGMPRQQQVLRSVACSNSSMFWKCGRCPRCDAVRGHVVMSCRRTPACRRSAGRCGHQVEVVVLTRRWADDGEDLALADVEAHPSTPDAAEVIERLSTEKKLIAGAPSACSSSAA